MEESIQYMTENACYLWNRKHGRKQKVTRIILHATAVRGVAAQGWFTRWNRPDVKKGVHLFVDDRMVCRYLPDTMEGWHVGGSGNRSSIGIEMCEDKAWTKAYFDKTLANTLSVVEALCRTHGIAADRVFSHREAHQRGWGSNHGDPDHWWRGFGYDMEAFRRVLMNRLHLPMEKEEPMRTKAALHLRQAPGMEGRILGVIPKGTALMVGRENGHWRQTVYRGIEGFVHGNWLQKEPFMDGKRFGWVLADVLNIRSGRGVEHRILGRVNQGKKLELLYFLDGWWSVAVPHSVAASGVGFVHGKWVATEPLP